jgi:hypothetical protein
MSSWLRQESTHLQLRHAIWVVCAAVRTFIHQRHHMQRSISPAIAQLPAGVTIITV